MDHGRHGHIRLPEAAFAISHVGRVPLCTRVVHGHFAAPHARTSIRAAGTQGLIRRAAAYNSPHGQPTNHEHEHNHGVLVATSKPEVARPPLYSVLLLNDDYTPWISWSKC